MELSFKKYMVHQVGKGSEGITTKGAEFPKAQGIAESSGQDKENSQSPYGREV